MLIRIVRMTFREDKVEDFLEIFHNSKDRIRHFEGCHFLQLLRDLNKPNVFITHSHWDNEQALDKYRHSELFTSTWAVTKVLFADKPLAFSSQVIHKVD